MLFNLIIILISCFRCSCFDEYENVCFKIINRENKSFKMMVNKKTNFIPDILRIRFYGSIIGDLSQNYVEYFYITKSDDNICDESLSIPGYFASETNSVEFSIEIYWLVTLLEYLNKVYDPPTPKQSFIIEGLKYKIIKIPLIFDEKTIDYPTYNEDNFTWSPKLECELKLCMKVFNHDGIYQFMKDLKCQLSNSILLDTYNYLLMTPYRNQDMTHKTYSKEYLIEIYKCGKQEKFSKFNIIVGDHIKSLELKLYGNSHEVVYKMGFSIQDGTFKKLESKEYSQNLIDVDIAMQKSMKELNIQPHRMTNNKQYDKSIIYSKNEELYSLKIEEKNGKCHIKNAYILVKDEEKKTEYFREVSENERNGNFPTFFILS